MSIVDLVAPIVEKTVGIDVLELLKRYEKTYPPEIGLKLNDSGIMDIQIDGGDIAIVGFWYYCTLKTVIAVATQDLILRLLIGDGMGIFSEGFGVGPIDSIPRETLQAVILMAISYSPYIRGLLRMDITVNEQDQVQIELEAKTVTGENLTIGLIQ